MAAQLDERSRRALCLRFGLEDDEPKTFKEIAAELGVHQETARAVLKHALERLRAVLYEAEATGPASRGSRASGPSAERGREAGEHPEAVYERREWRHERPPAGGPRR